MPQDQRRRESPRPRPVPRRRPEPFVHRAETIQAQGGIRAESTQGEFGSSWWARRWQSVIEGFRVGGRLTRGKIYARQGQVLNIDIRNGKVTARVQGSRPEPYDVSFAVKQLKPEDWDAVVEAIGTQALFVAKLLAGEMPHDIEKVFQSAGRSFFPGAYGDLKTSCSCPDEANPCKHIAAVYYLLGEEFDRDPFLILRLRGMERETLLKRLGTTAKAPKAEAAPREPVAADPSGFWALPPIADDFYGEVRTPPVTAPLVRRLGKFPLWRGVRPLAEGVESAYQQAGKAGLKTFLGEDGE